MHSYYQILSTPTADTVGSAILLHFDNKRYVFGNISEGTQRITAERSTKMVNVAEIFLTGKIRWDNTGGLLGLILSLADATANSADALKEKVKGPGAPPPKAQPRRRLGVHGGPNLMHTIATARHFVFRKGMPLDVHEYCESTERDLDQPSFSDENINVWPVLISPSNRTQQADSPKSARKRSFDEFKKSQEAPSTVGSQVALHGSDGPQAIRKAVVTEMFESSWRFDALFETPLAEVNLPAAIFVRNPKTNSIEPYKGILPGQNGFSDLEPITVLVRKPWPAAEIRELPRTSPSHEAVSYIVKDHDQRGKFNVQKALELKVQKGPLFNDLAQGRIVTSTDGKTITPEMVLDEPRLSTGTAILDIPSPDYIEPLLSRPEWKNEKIMKGVGAMIWILGRAVAKDPRWLEFVSRRATVEHVVISKDLSPNDVAFDSAAAASTRRHVIDPDHFPMPVHVNSSAVDLESAENRLSLREQDKLKICFGSRGLLVQTRPVRSIKTNEVQPPLDTAKVAQDVPKEVLQLGDQARAKVKNAAGTSLPGEDAEIITLGTGSALPSKYRNVSATLVRVSGYGSYLLDCGENTIGQLRRVFPAEELKEVLRDLKMIWISHMHADHHLGITSVVKAWYTEMFGDKAASDGINDLQESSSVDDAKGLSKMLDEGNHLVVASTVPMIHWLEEYSQVENFGYDKVIPITVSDSHSASPPASRLFWKRVPLDLSALTSLSQSPSPLPAAFRAATGIQDFQACGVPHCPGSKGIALTFPNEFKVTYSGDCRPSQNLAKIGMDSTVLIHEATFDDELAGDAIAKQHSTISEALGIAIRMKAKRVILTHFSQRYQKLPTMENLNAERIARLSFSTEGLKPGMEEVMDMDQQPFNVPIDVAIGATPMDTDSLTPTSSSSFSAALGALASQFPKESPNASLPSGETTAWRPGVQPTLNGTPLVVPPPVAVAFDYMRMKVKDIEYMHRFTPALLKLYEISGEGTEEEVMEINRSKGGKGEKQEKKTKDKEKKEKNKIKDKQMVSTGRAGPLFELRPARPV